MTDKEAMKLALDALGVVTKEMLAIRDELAEYGEGRPITNGIHQLLWDSSFKAYTETAIPAYAALKKALAEHAMRETQRLGQEIEQEPVAWLVEFENGEQELHFDEQSVGEIHTPLYSIPPQRIEQEQQIETLKRCLFQMQEAAKDLVEQAKTLTPPQRTEPLIGCVNHDCAKCKEKNT